MVAEPDRVADMVLPVPPELVPVVVRAHRTVDVGAACPGANRLECRVLEGDHVVEEATLLVGGRADHHRPLELRVVAPDGR